MPNTPSPSPGENAPLAGFRGWGPGIRGANGWTYRPAVAESLPPPMVADPCQALIATRRGAVLVMLAEATTPEDILAALEAAHTQVQRDLLAGRRRVA